jgi:hypothetical protein
MTCPVCGLPSAPNARSHDKRCGPCHNFGLVERGRYSVTIKRGFNSWKQELVAELIDVDNLDTYAHWLEALTNREEES